MKNDYDYLIVGQGLAGTTLAYQLMKLDKKVLVINQAKKITSSLVAAGLYNPITGRKMVKTWKADALFPYLTEFYQELQSHFSEVFFNDLNIYRPFLSIEEQNEWMGKSSDPDYLPFIKNINLQEQHGSIIKDEFGGLELDQSGFLNIPVFLSCMREYFKEKGVYYEGVVDENNLSLRKSEVSYEGVTAMKVIFCQGPDAITNHFFSWLPFSLVKGEILYIRTHSKLDRIYNRGVFVLPWNEDICKVGATYDTKDMSLNTTLNARQTLVEKLNNLVKFSYEIIDQSAGIRPATKDRRPFIGLHPNFETIGIFNGLGAKGVSLSPYFSKHFAYMLENGEELDSEINISRYFSLI
ncbi:MAG: FAD-dependent oxidoreductase [Bacteroidota bacterium]